MMDCRQAEEKLEPYLLDALDSEERRSFESHLDDCETCARSFQVNGEGLARFASSLPEMQTPRRLKQDLLARIESDNRPKFVPYALNFFVGLCASAIQGLAANSGKSAAALAVVAIVFSVVWHNARLNEPDTQGSEVTSQPTPVDGNLMARPIATVYLPSQATSARFGNIVSAESQLKEMTKAQRYLMYRMLQQVSTPQATSVKELQGTGASSRPRGKMFYNTSSEALLLALDLPPLPSHKVYQIWLIKGGVRYSAGTFTVDSTGYGKAVIIPVAPLAEFEAIGITVEPIEGSPLPTGTSVLKGDL